MSASNCIENVFLCASETPSNSRSISPHPSSSLNVHEVMFWPYAGHPTVDEHFTKLLKHLADNENVQNVDILLEDCSPFAATPHLV